MMNEKNRLGRRFRPLRKLALALALAGAGLGAAACDRGETQEVKTVPASSPRPWGAWTWRSAPRRRGRSSRSGSWRSSPRSPASCRGSTVETGDEIEQGALIASGRPARRAQRLSPRQRRTRSWRAPGWRPPQPAPRAETLAKAGIVSAAGSGEHAARGDQRPRPAAQGARPTSSWPARRPATSPSAAPIAGTVIEKTVEQGQIIASASGNVSGGSTLVKMADLETVRARALVDEVDIGRIRPGQQATVDGGGLSGPHFRGRGREDRAAGRGRAERHDVPGSGPAHERRGGCCKPGMNAEVGSRSPSRGRHRRGAQWRRVLAARGRRAAGTAARPEGGGRPRAGWPGCREERQALEAGSEPRWRLASGAGERRAGWRAGARRAAVPGRGARRRGEEVPGRASSFVKGAQGPEPRAVLARPVRLGLHRGRARPGARRRGLPDLGGAAPAAAAAAVRNACASAPAACSAAAAQRGGSRSTSAGGRR